MPNVLDILGENGLDYEKLLYLLFEEYKKRKAKGSFSCENSEMPKNLIRYYYESVDEPIFESLMTNFKKQYILNESKLELVHAQEEIDGLGEVYEYIHKFLEVPKINVYTVLALNNLLFSKTSYPEAGGVLRTADCYIADSRIDFLGWAQIPLKLQELYNPINELVQKGISLGANKDRKYIIEYIDECVDINCELIKIHPFIDGNGRCVRAFTNLLFKLAKIPPVYVKPSEREEYQSAMQQSLGDNNNESIHHFYYCKICDSIAELDMNFREEKAKTK